MDAKQVKAIRGSMGEGDFALLIGVNLSTVWRWEHGGTPPKGASVTLLELIRDHRQEAVRLLWKRLNSRMKA